jgi:predicted MFS family arabinose efflux permease
MNGERYTRWVLGLMLAVAVFNVVDRTIVAILLESIKRDLQLSDAELGWIVGFAFAAVYAVTSIPVARMADVGVRRSIIATGLAAWSAFTLATAWAQGFWSLFVLRMAVGVGEAGGGPPSQSLIADLVPAERRARALAVVPLGSLLGLALGMIAGGWINELYGWRTAFIAAGAPGILLAIVVRLTVREPVRAAQSGQRESAFAVMRFLLRAPSYRWIALAGTLAVFSSLGRNLWEPTFLIRVYGMSSGEAGTWYPLIGPVFGMIGMIIGARIGDRRGARDLRAYLWVSALGMLAATPAVAAFVLWPTSHRLPLPGALPDLPVGFLFCMLGSLLSVLYTAPFLALVQTLAPSRMRAMSAALFTAIITFLGQGLGPLAVGLLNQALAPAFGQEAIRYSLLLMAGAMLLCAGACVAGARTLREDAARVAADAGRAAESGDPGALAASRHSASAG